VFREEADAAFHESVVREHLEQGMPVVELHRNHGVPLAAVKKWIELYRQGGRAALDAAAAEIARRNAVPLSAKRRAQLAEKLRARDADVVRAALIAVACRKVDELKDAVFAVLETRSGGQVIEALITLGELGADEHLDRAERLLDAGYHGWIAAARLRMPKQRR
jgi:transposase-like protein